MTNSELQKRVDNLTNRIEKLENNVLTLISQVEILTHCDAYEALAKDEKPPKHNF